MEPFQDPIAIEEYRRKLGFQNCKIFGVVVYAKCDRDEREELWEAMVELATQRRPSWIIGGDFNVIVFDERESKDSLEANSPGGMGGLKRSAYSKVTHLIRHGSDHAPLHLECNSNAHHIVKSFKFLNFWTKHHTFMEVVKENRDRRLRGNPFYVFHHKLKKLKRALVQWSRNTYGNIFQQIATIEDTIKVKELQFENNASRENRMQLHQAQAELTRFLHLEEEYWKQKAGMKWFNDGDRNTNFFHSYKCWEVIKLDVLQMVRAFFCGSEIPQFITHTNLVLLPKKETAFVKGRSIAENILLAQEIIRDINLRAKLTNVVIKLDMAKAYDRLSWIFFTKVLRQFGFGEVLIDMKMMKRLRKYEKASGQLVNTDKSCYYVHHKVFARVNIKIKRHTNMRNGSFPCTYLGYPVFYGRRKQIYYEDLIKKVMKRILSWQNRLLSFGGRYVLVNHVLQTMPVYLLSAMNPPSGVIKQLHRIFAKFF
ncbi:uncharacterized protein LOC132053727 [Lycium ferocissimum]|uniref:uncharacterized protein LOC132053727 n=1 Tax=Lycium ferocissimum TaxID=112874 RepID=UPI002814D582|nr:uncharacterized protein LOC132053727 [Lycium ferocissimum]